MEICQTVDGNYDIGNFDIGFVAVSNHITEDGWQTTAAQSMEVVPSDQLIDMAQAADVSKIKEYTVSAALAVQM